MPLYRWPTGTIAQLESAVLAPGKIEVIVRPHAGADPKSLHALHHALSKNGIVHFINGEGNDYRLIIPDIKDEKPLLALLENGGWTAGLPQVIATPADKQIAQDSMREKIQKNAVFGSALFYDLGNISCIVSGIQRARHNRDGKWTASDVSEMMMGVAFSIGDALLTVYGKDKTKDPLIAFSEALSSHLTQQGIDIPAATPDSVHKSGFFASVNDFLSYHITSIKCLSETVGGGFMIKAALKKDNFNAGKLTAGLLVSTGWLATFMLDKPHAPGFEFKPKDDPVNMNTSQKIWHWLNENPRGRIGTPFGMLNNLSNLAGSYSERKRFNQEVFVAHNALAGKSGAAMEAAQSELNYATRKQHDWGWNVLTASAFLVGHSLFGLSGDKESVHAATDNHEFRQDILAVAANVLANVPDKARAHVVDETATYVTSIKGVTQNHAEVVQAINDHIDHIRQSPFMAPVNTDTAAQLAR